jgi:hypothetical protein
MPLSARARRENGQRAVYDFVKLLGASGGLAVGKGKAQHRLNMGRRESLGNAGRGDRSIPARAAAAFNLPARMGQFSGSACRREGCSRSMPPHPASSR